MSVTPAGSSSPFEREALASCVDDIIGEDDPRLTAADVGARAPTPRLGVRVVKMVSMIEMELFDERDAATVASWAGDEAASMAWCSLPTVTSDVVVGWASEPSVEAFVLRDASRVVAYGEIWVDPDGAEVELAHLIVAPGMRRRGHGRRLVEELVAQARRHYPMVGLRVHSRNDAAIRCYRSAGFERVGAAEEAEWNVGQPVSYVWMRARTAS